MNLFQLVLKQMRQRALGTWLTLLSVMLGVALAIAIMICYREAGSLFGQTDYGADLIIGAKGSATQLVMNTIYHMDQSPGNIPYPLYEAMLDPRQFRAQVKIAIPYVVGDSYQGKYRIVGTSPKLFGYDDDGNKLDDEHTMEYRPGKRYEIAEGHDFHPKKFEAVIGSDVARLTGLKLGSTFQATHGEIQTPNPDIHPEMWTVVGILGPTRTANDRVLFIPFLSLYTIGEHDIGLKAQWAIQHGQPAPSSGADSDTVKAYKMNDDGRFELFVPKEMWELSAIMVKARSPFMAQSLFYTIKNGNIAQAAQPAVVMQEFFGTFLRGPTVVLLVVALLVTVVAGIGILVSIYNSVSARLREIAILRALGATRNRVLMLICTESALIGLFGGLLGLLTGHLLGAVGSIYFDRYVGQGINWIRSDQYEWLYLVAVIVIALVAGLVPAMKAYRTPVATNLVAT